MATSRSWAGAALGLLLWSSPIGAAEVAVLKSTEAAAWRPAIDALKRSLPGHTVTEYDLRGDRNMSIKGLGSRHHFLSDNFWHWRFYCCHLTNL